MRDVRGGAAVTTRQAFDLFVTEWDRFSREHQCEVSRGGLNLTLLPAKPGARIRVDAIAPLVARYLVDQGGWRFCFLGGGCE